jgi:hypothetical protein
MKVFTIAYMVNDSAKFNSEVMNGVMDSMRNFKKENDYGVFAVSALNEFEKLEKIEEITENFYDYDSDTERMEAIMNILGGM